jgi:hypothetical protein
MRMMSRLCTSAVTKKGELERSKDRLQPRFSDHHYQLPFMTSTLKVHLYPVVFFALTFCLYTVYQGNAHAQNRAIGARTIVLDDNSGHLLTLQTPPGMTGSSTLVLPLPPTGFSGVPSAYVQQGDAANTALTWNNALGYWQKTVGGGGGGVGPGTVHTIPVFTTASAIGNSQLTDDGSTLSYASGGLTYNSITGVLNSSGYVGSFAGYYIQNNLVFYTDGNANTEVGRAAGNTTSGSSGTFVGDGAGFAGVAGMANVFVGASAGINASTGAWNTCVGTGCAGSIGAGSDNTIVGGDAGLSINGGSSNVYVGEAAAELGTGGSDNVFVGQDAGRTGGAATANVVVGTEAAHSLANGINNTVVGSACAPSLTLESANTLLGSNTDITPGITNATGIGASVVPGASNVVVLGNGCNVGIKNLAPVSELQLGGNGTISLAPRSTNPAGNAGVYKIYMYSSGATHELRVVGPSGAVTTVSTVTP